MPVNSEDICATATGGNKEKAISSKFNHLREGKETISFAKWLETGRNRIGARLWSWAVRLWDELTFSKPIRCEHLLE